jgi:hypothetical protein
MTTTSDPEDPLDIRGDITNWPIKVGNTVQLRGYGQSRIAGVHSVSWDQVVIFLCPATTEDWVTVPRESCLQAIIFPHEVWLPCLWAFHYPWVG